MATQLTRDGFDPSLYPRTYRVSLGWKLLLVPAGALFAIGGIAGLVFVVLYGPGHPNASIWVTLFLSVTLTAFAGLGVYVALDALKYRVMLEAEGVEVLGLFRRRHLSRAEIRGHRTVRNQNGPATLVLVPKSESTRKLKISLIIKRDPVFDAWLMRLPDLDREELARSEQEIAATLYQDQMPQDREAHIKRLKRVAQGVNGATIVLCCAAFVLPDYQHLMTAALIAVPWLAVWLVGRFQPLYRFGAKRNDAHPDLTAVLMLPGFLLTAHALRDAHTFDWSGALLLSFAGGLALVGAALRADPWLRQQRWIAIFTCLFVLPYGFGAGFEIDVLVDSTQPIIYPAQVLAKRVSRGSKSTTYYLRLGPWGPITRDDEISVSAERYSATSMGDTVCVYVGKGALKVPWYQVEDCPRN